MRIGLGLFIVIISVVCMTIIFFAFTKLNLLHTKEQRNRIRKITMSLVMIILALSFLGAVSYKGPSDAIGKNKINLKNATREDWTQGENKQYVEQALKLYDIIAKNSNSNMVSKKDFREALSTLPSNYIKNNAKSLDVEDCYDKYKETLQLSYHLSEQKEYKKLYEEMNNSESWCWSVAMNNDNYEKFTYQIKGNIILCYCKEHKALENILPYHLYEAKIVRELEKSGLTGLRAWLKEQEDSGITVETEDHQKIEIYVGQSDEDKRMIKGIAVSYDEFGLLFDFDSYQGVCYRYLDDMIESTRKIGWDTKDVMADGYEKGILCRAMKKTIQKVKDGDEYDLTPIVEIVMDKSNVKQLCFNIIRYDDKKGSKLIVNNEQEIYQVLKLIGMRDEKALELIKELKCVSKTETGSKDGFIWRLSQVSVTDVDEDVDCITYMLSLSKE